MHVASVSSLSRAASPQLKSVNSLEIDTNHWKAMKFVKPIKIYENIWKFAEKTDSRKYGQIAPTPRGSILHHTKPLLVPYNADFWPYLAIFRIIHMIPLLS